MKIEEAKTKVCPFMVDYTFEANDCTATKYKNCICGDCMAWEFTKTETFKTIERKIGQELEEEIEVNGIFYFLGEDGETYYSDVIELDDSQKEGYCKRIGI